MEIVLSARNGGRLMCNPIGPLTAFFVVVVSFRESLEVDMGDSRMGRRGTWKDNNDNNDYRGKDVMWWDEWGNW